jgi:hypothetical protein
MQRRRGRVVRDPEFDAPGDTDGRSDSGVGVGLWTFANTPEAYQRLVANPFLAFALLIGWVGLLFVGLKTNFGWMSLPAKASLVVVPFFFQYHCLDCGTTGHLTRWRIHSCMSVRTRFESHRARRWRGPTPGVQTILWLYVFVLTSIFGFFLRH